MAEPPTVATDSAKPPRRTVRGSQRPVASTSAPRGAAGPRQQDAPGDTNRKIGLVLAGAGARGAYEAGMLSVLLPELERRGDRPTVFVGTSAGSLNAVLFASLAHLEAEQAAEQALTVWRSVGARQVFKPLVRSALTGAVRYIGNLLSLPTALAGMLDTGPLLQTVSAKVDWAQFHQNLLDGTIDTVALTATRCRGGRTQVFVESPCAAPLPETDDERAVDYAKVILQPEHVVASASIPVLFPPVRVGTADNGAWFMDGGVRLNAPIKPAILLGVDRVAVVATEPAAYVSVPPARKAGSAPSVIEAASQMMQGLLTDRMVEDLRSLSKTNQLVQVSPPGQPPISPGGDAYRTVEYLFAGPDARQPGQLGDRAQQVLAANFGGLRAIQHYDLALLSWIMGPGIGKSEILSYIFFEPEFISAAIEMGQRDGQFVINAAKGDLWRQDLPPQSIISPEPAIGAA